jgi:hypothetical protein
VAEGLHITHWTSQDLADQAVADGIVDAISPRTVRQILRDVDLQPHRTRYWRTARLDACFKERAEKVLGCYANAERLARQGIWTVAVDEMPNLPVLERPRRFHSRDARHVGAVDVGDANGAAKGATEKWVGSTALCDEQMGLGEDAPAATVPAGAERAETQATAARAHRTGLSRYG